MRKILIFIVALFFAGCSFRPQMPEVDTSFEYKFESSDINDLWWQNFNDENLNQLVDSALNHNIDLKLAYINLQTASLTLKSSKADLFPTIDISGSAGRSANYQTSAGDQNPSSSFSLSAVLNYEVDLWGRVRNSIASNEALFNASKFDYANARLSIASNVVNSYFALLALKMQEEVLKDTLKSYDETMRYRKKQLDVGATTQMVYLQSVASVQSAQISLNNTQNSLISAATALAILTGKSNDEILKGEFNLSQKLPKAPEINANISSDILFRRSDVASAYESLKSSNALVGVARAAYFPTISLTGLFGFSSTELDRLFVKDASLWSLAGSLTQNIFDYAKRANNVKIAKLLQSSKALNYEKTIKTALGEVKNALEGRKMASLTWQETQNLLNSQSEIYKLAQAQYESGYADHLTLLDAQRNLLNTRLSAISSQLALNNAVVEIYKAFGGGFKVENKE